MLYFTVKSGELEGVLDVRNKAAPDLAERPRKVLFVITDF